MDPEYCVEFQLIRKSKQCQFENSHCYLLWEIRRRRCITEPNFWITFFQEFIKLYWSAIVYICGGCYGRHRRYSCELHCTSIHLITLLIFLQFLIINPKAESLFSWLQFLVLSLSFQD